MNNEFLLALFKQLQASGYSIAGWRRFWADAWRRTRANRQGHPGLLRSWQLATLLLALVAAPLSLGIGLAEGPAAGLPFAVVLAVCLTLQQAYVWLHLGLNRRLDDGRVMEYLGPANLLCLLRGLGASSLLALSLSPSHSARLFLLIALPSLASDVVDGWLARHRRETTKLGQILDALADAGFAASGGLWLATRGLIPGWLLIVFALRFSLPLLAAVVSYFGFARQVSYRHSLPGKVAGLVESACFLLAALVALTGSGPTGRLLVDVLAWIAAGLAILATANLFIREGRQVLGSAPGEPGSLGDDPSRSLSGVGGQPPRS